MDLAHGDATSVGMDPGRLVSAGAVLDDAVERGVCPAAVLCVVRQCRIVWLSAHGAIGEEQPTQTDTLFDLASLTKPHTALVLLRLAEAGRLSLQQTVGDFLQGAPPALARVTLEQLATHVSGLPSWAPLYAHGSGQREMLGALVALPLQNAPGERYVYSDLGYILLGEILEQAGGARLSDLLQAEVVRPLGMRDTGFLPSVSLRPRIAPTANCPQRPGQTLVGEVHDANAHFLGGVAGHAGLFGAAPDLAILAAALLGDGSCQGRRILSVPALALVRRSALPAHIGGQSIGWFTHPNPMLPRGDLLSDEAFGHTGFTGTLIVCDPGYDLGVVLLTNRVMVPGDNAGIQAVRRRVLNMVASAVYR